MEWKRMVGSRAFYPALLLAIAGILAGVNWPTEHKVLETGTFYILWNEALTSDALVFFLPLASVLAYGDSFVQDIRSSYIRILISRQDRKAYVRDRMRVCMFSGGLIWLLAGICSFLILFLLLFFREGTGAWDPKVLQEAFWRLVRLVLIGSWCSAMAGAFGAFFLSSYMAFGLPFLSYYLLIILHDRYFQGYAAIDPVEWLKLQKDWGDNGIGAYLVILALIILFVVLGKMAMGERLEEI
ncbi:MAG: hypothetical protein PHS82_08475 [Lachnospiraceae bacterium]|nr:hypothetical protein [Lachnospiraceae bacterium]